MVQINLMQNYKNYDQKLIVLVQKKNNKQLHHVYLNWIPILKGTKML